MKGRGRGRNGRRWTHLLDLKMPLLFDCLILPDLAELLAFVAAVILVACLVV